MNWRREARRVQYVTYTCTVCGLKEQKRDHIDMKQWLIAIVVLLGAVGGLAVGVFPGETEALVYRDFKGIAFNRHRWLNDTTKGIRLRMVNDLIYRHRIDTMSRHDILALLGGGGLDAVPIEPTLTYLLSTRTMQMRVLRIMFDDSGRVLSVDVARS